MNSLRTTLAPLLALSLLAVPDVARGQTTASAPLQRATLAPADQDALDAARALEHNESLWNKGIDWNEKDASLQTIVAHVQSALEPNAPQIEVRARDVNRLTFSLTNAPIGTTLVSLANLANCRVWVFAGGIVIAPETALSDEERAAVKGKQGGDWTQGFLVTGSSASWSGRDQFERVAVSIISADLKARLAARGQTAPVAPPKSTQSRETAPFQLPFGELSPVAQRVLQELCTARNKRTALCATPVGLPGFSPPPDARPQPTETTLLPPSVLVCFDDTRPNSDQVTLFLQSDEMDLGQASWFVSKPK